jgi:heme/copper-type cytochrome/quinol oxidase subunit 4
LGNYHGMSNTKRVYINTISALLIISLLFIENLSSERALATSPSVALNDSQSNTNATTSGSTNTTNATGANLAFTLENATIALENATAVATNATRIAEEVGANATLVLTNVSQTAANVSQTAANVSQTAAEIELLLEQARANFTLLSLAQQLQGFSSTISISVLAIAAVIGVPLVLNLFLRYHQGKETSINQLYRMLVAIGVIFVVILIVAYLNSLIWFNTAQGPSNVLTSLLETQQNFLTILGTAFASLVAFYFGTRGTQTSNAERTTSITGPGAAQKTLEVIDTNPINGTVGVEVDSPVTATFSNSIRGSTIDYPNTFSVKDANGNTVRGRITLTDNNTTIRFNPVTPFNRDSRYTVTITKGIMDISGASLAEDMEWHFTTVV